MIVPASGKTFTTLYILDNQVKKYIFQKYGCYTCYIESINFQLEQSSTNYQIKEEHDCLNI